MYTKQKAMSKPILIRPCHKFNWSKIFIEEPKPNRWGGSYSKVQFIGKNNVKRPICIEMPEQNVLGISGIWQFGLNANQQTMDNIEGLQISYPMTSKETMNNPTELERSAFEIFDKFRNMVATALKGGFFKASKATRSACKNAGNNLISAVKPIYNYTKDGNKPQRAYFKLNTKDKGKKMKCWTKIYDSGDEQQTFDKFMANIGETPDLTTAKIILDLQDIYWGSHNNTPYGASIRLRVREVRLIPIKYDDTSFLFGDLTSEDEDEEEEEDVYSFLEDIKKEDEEDEDEEEEDEEEVTKPPIPTPRKNKHT